ncbi:amphi-Trp domain-containing protein [Halohasta litchfieldiae]|jgi:amphi-Trp domain-containing protein|uniref:Amphi-Trp domain-containing protein n=1 Tax=Halohasta litchfieldiae TaxID=1073996 RepID=A0A1H6RKR8_9EURY|nr:amphi-Trp domain-containing protein [Halohasta litchfieldiae]ATW89822.1 amphi-Trp domain-containing protein [Halohasta litchfieldiae]SEI52185.1 amphi-Trp domain-containing protein [Halohasta litchfieldiae]
MPEEVLFKSESTQSRQEIADYLRAVADRLSAGEAVSLSAGDDSVTMEIPDRPTFEVKAERETDSSGGNPEKSLELEIEWDENGSSGSSGGSLSIE